MIFNLSTGGAVPGALKKPVIVVSYPYGALCTVTNGDKTYQAHDASGSVSFLVDPGTWTVMATRADGTVVSQGVLAAPGKWYQVELSFWRNELYTPGNQWPSVTGGWKAQPCKTRATSAGYATEYALEATSTELGVRWTSYGTTQSTKGIALMTMRKIPLAGFGAIKVTLGTFDFTANITNGILFIMDKEVTDGMDVYTEAVAKTTFKNSDLGAGKEFTVDVSSYPDEYYIGVGISSNANTNDNYFCISSMVMEVGT